MPKLFVYINCVCRYINAFFEPIIYYFMKSFAISDLNILQNSCVFISLHVCTLHRLEPYIRHLLC